MKKALDSPAPPFRLLAVAGPAFPVPLARQRLLQPPFLARLQVIGVFLDLLDDVFLLHLALKAAKGGFESFSVLEKDLSQVYIHPLTSTAS